MVWMSDEILLKIFKHKEITGTYKSRIRFRQGNIQFESLHWKTVEAQNDAKAWIQSHGKKETWIWSSVILIFWAVYTVGPQTGFKVYMISSE